MSIPCRCRVLDSDQMPMLQQELFFLYHDCREEEVPAGKTQRRKAYQNASGLTWKGQRWRTLLYPVFQITYFHLSFLLKREYIEIEENPKCLKVKCFFQSPDNRFSIPVATAGLIPEISYTYTSKTIHFLFHVVASYFKHCSPSFLKFYIHSLT